MTDWLHNLSVSTSTNLQTMYAADAGLYSQEYAQSTDLANYQGMRDPMNAWMWKHHPLKAYFQIEAFGKTNPIFVTGKQALIGTSVASLVLFMLMKR